MRTLLILSLVLFGCSDDKTNNTPADAAVDAPPTVDLTCTNYCTTITASCTGALAQFGGTTAADATAHCMNTCATFMNSATQSGDTLGCHLYHAQVAGMPGMATAHCPHAGPGGDAIGATTATCGDPCTNFCAIEIAACGLKGAAANTTGVYTDVNDCMAKCGTFTTASTYTVNTTTFPAVTPTGDTLACRLYHATNAIIPGSATAHCPHTAPNDATKTPPNAACHN